MEAPVIIADDREAGMMTTAGVQGVGKTYQNMICIANYVKDDIARKKRGRKVLIFDTNGEYTESEFKKAGHNNVQVKLLKVKDVQAYGKSDLVEIRRIDAKHLTIPQKKAILEYILRVYVNGMLVIEDVNTYILNVTHMEEIVGRIVNLRHRAVDVLISYQSLRAIEPRIYANSRWFRMHFQADNVDDVKGKLTNVQLYKIAQILINFRHYNGDERFFLYITKFGRKIEGNFSREEFEDASRKYLNMNKKLIDEFMEINECEKEAAYSGLIKTYYKMYYDNPDKDKAAA
jgi:hypothetical protein